MDVPPLKPGSLSTSSPSASSDRKSIVVDHHGGAVYVTCPGGQAGLDPCHPAACLSSLSKVASTRMKIVVDMLPANYDTFLGKLSLVYGLLKNGIVVHPSGAAQDRLIQIACDVGEAEMLLYCARQFCPEAVSQLEEAIKRPQPL